MSTAISKPDRQAGHAAGAADRPALASILLSCGVIGPVLFTVAVLVEGATRPGYSAWHHPISTLSLGAGGWMQTANFVVTGVLVLGSAVGLRWVLHPGRGSTWAPILVGVCGLGLVVAGLSPTDPGLGYPPGAATTATVHGTIHLLASNAGFLSISVASFVLARRFAATPGWRAWAIYSIVPGVLVVVLAVAASLTEGPDPSSPFGLVQRLSTFAGLAWVAVVAARLLTTTLPVIG